jgi:bleomycin hydrolase
MPLVFLSTGLQASAQEAYKFQSVINLQATPVKSQDNTGTCWSYSGHSFLESELLRMGKGEWDLSEMFHARLIYEDKADNYVRRQGKANFSQGSLAHDVLRMVKKHGLIPQEHYTGLQPDEDAHNHEELEVVLFGIVEAVAKQSNPSLHWRNAVKGVLDAYLGKVPEKFKAKGKDYTPRSFAEMLGVNPDDYVSITSFSHHPFQSWFVLEVADNYSNGSFWNVPLGDLIKVIDHALEKGFTLAWDADVSEPGFVTGKGVALMPAESWSGRGRAEIAKLLDKPVVEMMVTQALRQQEFDTHHTTDDHLMHIVGKAKDERGNFYYVVKNSWGTGSGKDGFMYISVPYMQMKTISVMVHKSGLPAEVSGKIDAQRAGK